MYGVLSANVMKRLHQLTSPARSTNWPLQISGTVIALALEQTLGEEVVPLTRFQPSSAWPRPTPSQPSPPDWGRGEGEGLAPA